MIAKEFVMAVLCAPMSGRALLRTEQISNVTILRRLEYDCQKNYFSGNGFTTNPFKLMFVFGEEDAIVVSSAEDKQEVERRLNALSPFVFSTAF